MTRTAFAATISGVTYNLDNLGWKEFEHLVQSLATKTIGPRVSSFGAGADGGREAIWEGEAKSLGMLADWNGYGIVQAKYSEFATKPAANLEWLEKALVNELRDWAKADSNRIDKPDFILFATNVRLSPTPGGGKDSIRATLRHEISELGLPIADFRVWDFDDISSLLDDASDIRRRYAAFVTAGDVLSQILELTSGHELDTARCLRSAVGRSLMEDAHIGLTQAGAMDDTRVTISDVFVDLPFDARDRQWDPTEYDDEGANADVLWGHETEGVYARETGAASFIIESLNISRPPGGEPIRPPHTVLVGGPGQGKSTVTQWLAQLYRVAFLAGSELETNVELAPLISQVSSRAKEIGMPVLRSRRWPTRVVLTEFADFIAANKSASLLHFIAAQVNAGSAVTLQPQDLLRWLERYPWVLLIDGLDEVPDSSNRTQVVRAIKEFLVEASTVGGDVSIVATTRPQGYANEFHADAYMHVELQPLDIPTALKCAHALLEVRFSGAHATVARVMNRLEKASEDESTLRLFTSPLQVTILTILLEKLGKAPGDRWRLFSAYYEIILSREQEKSGGLSELLQRYESDIAAIHRTVGYELQQRSSEAGETSAALSREEFELIARSRFSEQGHNSDAVEVLMADFTRLVTDRLVFLTYGSADKLGFELRSLQEFMAGEHIVNFPDSQVPDLLGQLAGSSHWRNVVLFAVGGIFAKKEHLRAEVTLLCATLNREAETQSGVLLGSDLAADILADGSCASIPKYARDLADTASEIVSGRAGDRLSKLASLRDAYSEQIVRERARSTSPASRRTWLNRAVLLAELEDERGDGEEHLSNLVRQAEPQLLRDLIRHSWVEGNMRIASACGALVGTVSPWEIFALSGHTVHRRPVPGHEDQRPQWIQHFSTLTSFRTDVWREESQKSAIHFTLTPLRSDLEAWKWLQQHCLSTAPELRAIASFAIDPNESKLSEALGALAAADREAIVNFAGMPWVLSACIRFARSKTEALSDPKITWSERLLKLAESAAAGELGNLDAWLAAEAVTPTQSPLLPLHIAKWAQDESHRVPLNPAVALAGVPLLGTGFQFRGMVRGGEHQSSLAALASAVSETDSDKRDLCPDARHLFEFILSQHLRSLSDIGEAEESGIPALEWLLRSLIAHPAGLHRWATWLHTLFEVGQVGPADLDALHNLGLSRWVIDSDSRAKYPSDDLIDLYRQNPERWGIVRLVAMHNPRAAAAVQHLLPVDSDQLAREVGLTLSFKLAHALDGNSPEAVIAESVKAVIANKQDGFDFSWLVRQIISNQKAPGFSMLARQASDESPWRSQTLDDLLWAQALA